MMMRGKITGPITLANIFLVKCNHIEKMNSMNKNLALFMTNELWH
jgi:hypothetical protein